MTLQINPDNPRYFLYKGKPIYLIGAGDQYSQSLFKKLKGSGVNSYRKMVVPTIPPGSSSDSPYECKNGVDQNWGGFDNNYWQGLKKIAMDFKKQGIMMFLIVFSTCLRRKPVWHEHLWSEKNGGPFSDKELEKAGGMDPAVTLFYKIGDLKKCLFNAGDIDDVDNSPGYDTKWNWQYKSQYRQEQFLAKVMKELPEKEFPNIGIVLQWEIFSGWSSADDWVVHMVDFLKKIRGKGSRPIGLGTHITEQIDYVNGKQEEKGDPVFSLLEAHNINYKIENFEVSDRFPIIYEGFHVREEGYFTNKNTKERCRCYEAGTEDKNIQDSEDCMLAAVQKGMNCSLPFPGYWDKPGGYVSKLKCKEKYGIDTNGYKVETVGKKLIAFTKHLRKDLENVKTWNNEPGDEITGQSLKICKERWGS